MWGDKHTDRLRLRSFLGNNRSILVVTLLITAGIGGWLAGTAYLTPETTTEERSVTVWESTGEFDHRATVTRQNPLYETGTTLSDRPVYFTAVSPTLDGAFAFDYSARERGNLSGRIVVAAVLRGVGGDDDGGSTLWQTRREVNTTTVSGLAPGQTVRVPFSVEMDALGNRSAEIEEALGRTPGGTRIDVVATVTYEGTVNGRPVADRRRYTLPTRFQQNRYEVDNGGPQVDEYAGTRSIEVPTSYGPLYRIGGPLLFVLSVAGLVAMAGAWTRGLLDVTPRERAVLEYRDDRDDYDDWITTMSLPDEIFDRTRVTADSLADLVDFAIDTDNAVVEDPDRGLFAVVDDCCYVFEPPVAPDDGATAAAPVSPTEGDDEGEDDALKTTPTRPE